MNLQDYVKYLVCVLLANLQSVYSDTSPLDDIYNYNELKNNRGIVDLVVGRLRPCGTCLCGRANSPGRFLGGEITDSHEFPWIAQIYVQSENSFNGVLINDRYILTAASPLINVTAGEIKVALGEYNRCHNDISSANSSVERVIQHHAFDYISRTRDLALLQLSRPIKFERRISPICLPNPGSEYLGQVGTLVGWSDTDSKDDKKECRPRKVGLPILGKKECFKGGVERSTFHDDSGCVGVIGADPIACDNDAGSAVFYRSYYRIYDLVGILSDVNDCDNDDVGPAVYTKVGPHLDWILQHTKNACYCTK